MSRSSKGPFPSGMVSIITSLDRNDSNRLWATAVEWANYLGVKNPAKVLYTAFWFSVTEDEREKIWMAWARSKLPTWGDFCDNTYAFIKDTAIEQRLCKPEEFDAGTWSASVTERKWEAETFDTTFAINKALDFGQTDEYGYEEEGEAPVHGSSHA